MMKAPFRFAPVPRAVFFPAWADRVSHDVPLVDGLSGEIAFAIEAVTPLLVGGPRRKATDNSAGEVWPVRLPDGRYALPGSALQGMVRSLLEVAAFANLAPFVRDRRYAMRDIGTGQTAIETYRRLVVGNVQAGWLVRRGAHDAGLIPCTHDRIGFEKILELLPQEKRAELQRVLEGANDANARTKAFLRARGASGLEVEDPELGNATLVFTGKAFAHVNERTGRPNPNPKTREFLFFGPSRREARRDQARPVPAAVFSDFLLIHEPPVDSGQKPNPNWELWKPAFERGEPVPVFWLPDGQGGIAALGTAFMFKLAMPLSTHELLRNSSADHRLDAPPDLPSLIFGSVAGREGAGLKRRASFDWAVATLPDGAKLDRGEREAVLLAPKPGFYPFYIRQPKVAGNRLGGQTWAVYMEQKQGGPERERPESAGVKIWPAHGHGVRIPEPAENVGNKVRNRLNALPKGTRFEGCRLRFHNLRPAELGALLWALSFGDLSGEKGFLHRLGMGKPLGLGMIRIRLTSARLLPNGEPPEDGWSLEGLIDAFTGEMERFHRAKGGAWAASPQVKALLKAADPSANAGLDLTYLGTPEAHSWLRRDGVMLPPYVDFAGEIPRGGVLAERGGSVAQGAASRPAVPQWRPELHARARLADGRVGTIIYEEDGIFTVKLDDGEEVDCAAADLGRP